MTYSDEQITELIEWNNRRSMKYADDAAAEWRSFYGGDRARFLEGLSAKHGDSADALEHLKAEIDSLDALNDAGDELIVKLTVERDTLREQLAARDAVIAEVKRMLSRGWDQTDPYDLDRILSRASESVLAERDAEIRAEAWDEGARATLADEGYMVTEHASILALNPYRKEES